MSVCVPLLGCLGAAPLQPRRGVHNSVEVLRDPLLSVVQSGLVPGLCRCSREDTVWGFFCIEDCPILAQDGDAAGYGLQVVHAAPSSQSEGAMGGLQQHLV